MKFSFSLDSLRKLFLSGLSIFLGAFFFTILISTLFSLQESLQNNAAENLGGDIKISSTQGFTQEEKEFFSSFASYDAQIKTAFIDSFTAMIVADDSQTLTSIFSVDDLYPLYGQVVLESGEFFLPKNNEIFVDADFAKNEKIFLGDTVNLGKGEFIVAGIFESLPDTQGGFSFFGSTAIISRVGLEHSQINLLENRSTHIALFASQNPEQFEPLLEEKKIETDYRITTAWGNNTTSGRIFSEVKKLSLTLIALVTLLFATSFFMGVYFYIQSQVRVIAVLQSLGMLKKDIMRQYVLSLGIFWSCIGLLGIFLGVGIILSFSPMLSEILGQDLEFSLRAFVSSIFLVFLLPSTALILLVRKFFAISPTVLLKGEDSSSDDTVFDWKDILFWKQVGFFLLLLSPFAVLLGILSSSIYFPFWFFLVLAVLFLIIWSLLFVFFKGLKFIKKNLSSFFSRTLLSFLTQKGQKKYFVLSGFFALFFIVSTTATLQKSFIENLQSLSGEEAPSAFFLDIRQDDAAEVEKILSEDGRTEIFSIIRAKIVRLSGRTLTEKDSRELTRAFNINFSSTPLPTETVTSGEFWSPESDEKIVSVESVFAEENDISLGDEIIFDVLGRDIPFVVGSIRSLTQRDMNPWFMFTFPKNTLSTAPKSYIGFWWARDTESVAQKKSEVVTKFPNVSVIETQKIKDSLAEVFESITVGIFWISILLFFSSSLTVFSFLRELLQGRKKMEKTLFKIGVHGSLFSRLLWAEIFFMLGIPFFLSLVFSWLAVFLLGYFLFDFTVLSISLLPFIFFVGIFAVLAVFVTGNRILGRR